MDNENIMGTILSKIERLSESMMILTSKTTNLEEEQHFTRSVLTSVVSDLATIKHRVEKNGIDGKLDQIVKLMNKNSEES